MEEKYNETPVFCDEPPKQWCSDDPMAALTQRSPTEPATTRPAQQVIAHRPFNVFNKTWDRQQRQSSESLSPERIPYVRTPVLEFLFKIDPRFLQVVSVGDHVHIHWPARDGTWAEASKFWKYLSAENCAPCGTYNFVLLALHYASAHARQLPHWQSAFDPTVTWEHKDAVSWDEYSAKYPDTEENRAGFALPGSAQRTLRRPPLVVRQPCGRSLLI
jgi:hypothetical protein